MKVLWISNVIFPEACYEINMPVPVVGGWMYSSALSLINANLSIELRVASLYSGSKMLFIDKYRIGYYLIPSKDGNLNYSSSIEKYYKDIKSDFKPDIIHIHGSEYPHSLAALNACGKDNVIVSIQGLVSIIAKYYLGVIPKTQIYTAITLRDLIRKDSLFNQQKRMCRRGQFEQELLRGVDHVIGRTSWDKSHTWSINPNAKYHFCNETLRLQFYNKEWRYKNCIKYTIFLSQAHYPLKGIQQVIKSLPLVLRHFPKTKIFIAGKDFMNSPFWKRNGFSKYLSKLIKKNNIAGKIEFLGVLNEAEMANWYLNANVFVCPSSIENSPNSIGEAQLIGTPCIASYVGGNMDMIKNAETGFLYRYEETELLAMRICEIFADSKLAERLSLNERMVAVKRHSASENANSLNKIYKSIKGETVQGL